MNAPRRIVQGLVLVTSIGLAGWLVASANAKPPVKASTLDAGMSAATDGGTLTDAGAPKRSEARDRVYFPATKAPLGGVNGGPAMGDAEGLSGLAAPDTAAPSKKKSGQTKQKQAP